MMRIGIDAYPLIRPTRAGICCYVYNMVKNILEQDNENEYYLYNNLGKGIDLNYPNLHHRACSGYSPINKFSTAWMVFNSMADLVRDKINVFWGPQGIIPPRLPKSVKSIMTSLDLTYYLFPRTMAIDNYFVYKFLFKKSLINAQKIIAISYSTSNDLKSVFKDEKNISEKIDVIYCGIDTDKFKPIKKEKAKEYVADHFNIVKNYILFVGTIEPRKNIPRLLEAFKILKTRYSINHQLVFAGAEGWKNGRIKKIYQKSEFKEDDVKFLGYVIEDDLVNLYSGADLFVMPSLYEGFGIPSLEAMACGTPVAASNISVFREILNDSAIFFDPYSSESIAECACKVISNNLLKEELFRKGIGTAKLFLWNNSAAKLINLFKELQR